MSSNANGTAANLNRLLELDRRHVWHPYQSMHGGYDPYVVESARGVTLRLADGREVIDGMASWWCAIHGYNHPVLNKAARDQLERMAHVMFGGLTHEPAISLAERLVDIAPAGLESVFLCDSGSVSVEVAIKAAIQYWHSLGQPEKSRLVTLRGGYHGDTLGAMSVCDPVTGMHHLFSHILPKQFFVDEPTCRSDADWDDIQIEGLARILESRSSEIAALILEPLVQGAGGMRFYCPEFLRQARRLCDLYEVLLIADEIATGFGRTGSLFACEQAGVTPDLMCVGKALTGGYMTLAAMLTTRKVSEVISYQGPKALMHGPTFMGNPLACAVANASIRLLLKSDWKRRIREIEQQLKNELAPCIGYPPVADVRVFGAIGVVELKEPVDVPRVQSVLVENGVWLRPFGKLLYTMPPYVIKDEELSKVTSAMRRVVAGL